ncbi:MAG: hypothetical protein WCF23_03100 [Candidatus Nitrosopolaris sp.]
MTWFRGCKVVALFTTHETKNSWVMLSGPQVGSDNPWFKLYDAGDSYGFINMFSIFVGAKQMNTVVDIEIFDNEAAGMPPRIKQVYGW